MEKSGEETRAQDVKSQCIFCQIVSGKVSSKKVYEDDKCLAILDINPANAGHILLLPKEHYALLPLISADTVEQMFNVAKRISQTQISVLKADGTNIFVANGAAAGQRSPHAMMHIIPRKEKDGITVFSLPQNEMSPSDSDNLLQAIKAKLDDLMRPGGT